MKIIVATHNENKLRDLMLYLEDTSLDAIPLSTMSMEEPEETGETFEENALLKARHSFNLTGLPSIADDSGFCMVNLDGIPGIYAARFAKTVDGHHDYKQAFNTLQTLLGDKDPATEFVCTLAYVDNAQEKVFKGIVQGYFDFSKKNTDGFGYTPIFVPKDNNPDQLSLAEMGNDRRREISARKKATILLLQWLSTHD